MDRLARGFWGRLASLLVAVSLLGCVSGCGEKDTEEVISLKGRVEKLRRNTDTTGEISVRYFNEKQDKELVGSAAVTPETRIEKNGQPATLQDIQEGMQVTGQVRYIKKDGQRTFQAVKIQIESPATSSPPAP